MNKELAAQQDDVCWSLAPLSLFRGQWFVFAKGMFLGSAVPRKGRQHGLPIPIARRPRESFEPLVLRHATISFYLKVAAAELRDAAIQ